jgi:hypothetical protein
MNFYHSIMCIYESIIKILKITTYIFFFKLKKLRWQTLTCFFHWSCLIYLRSRGQCLSSITTCLTSHSLLKNIKNALLNIFLTIHVHVTHEYMYPYIITHNFLTLNVSIYGMLSYKLISCISFIMFSFPHSNHPYSSNNPKDFNNN